MPTHEFLKDDYGLVEEGVRAKGAVVDREQLLAVMEKAFEERPERPAEKIDKILASLKYELVEVTAGDFAIQASDSVGGEDGKLHFTIKEGDVLLKVFPPKGDFILLHLRENEGKWKVVSEYLD